MLLEGSTQKTGFVLRIEFPTLRHASGGEYVKNNIDMNKLRILKFLIAALVVTAGVMVGNQSLDNDSWYILAEGRELVENGIYYEDRLSMHEGLEVTVQNYGFAVIFYLIYQAFGPIGIYIGMLLLNLLLCYLIYKICMLLSDKNENLSLLIAVLTDLLLSYGFVVTRAQMVSYCILMLVIYLLELYVKTDKSKNLWWIPVLSLVQINLHASLWPMIILVVMVYIIDSFKSKKLHLEGYRTKPLLLVFFTSVLAGFLNPYGLKMMTFILTSYGVPEAQDYITELQPFRPLDNGYNILLFSSVVMTIFLYMYGKKQNIRIRWLLMLFGFLALGLNTVKGLSHLILVLLFPLAAVYKDFKINKKYRKWCLMATSWMGILAFSVIIASSVVLVSKAIDGPDEKMIELMNKLDVDVGEREKDDIKVYADFKNGGFVEYRGYKPYADSRMEVFIKANNGKEDIFQELYNLKTSGTGIREDEFLRKYNFDYLVVDEFDKLYDVDEGYELVFEKDNGDDSNGVRLYKKVNV